MSFNLSEIQIEKVDSIRLFDNSSPFYHYTQYNNTDTMVDSNMMGTHKSEYVITNKRNYNRA